MRCDNNGNASWMVAVTFFLSERGLDQITDNNLPKINSVIWSQFNEVLTYSFVFFESLLFQSIFTSHLFLTSVFTEDGLKSDSP